MVVTEVIGYLVQDSIDDPKVFHEWPFAEDFGPDGLLFQISDYPSKNHSPSRVQEFQKAAMTVYAILRNRGYKKIMIAMTLYCNAFDDYELKYLDRKVDPASHDDWLALEDEVYIENVHRETAYRAKHETLKGKIRGFFRGKKYRADAMVKGVLAVARIRDDLPSPGAAFDPGQTISVRDKSRGINLGRPASTFGIRKSHSRNI